MIFEYSAPSQPLERWPWCPPAYHLVRGVLQGSSTVPVIAQQASTHPDRQRAGVTRLGGALSWCPGTSEALRGMADFQQSRGLCREPLMQKYFGVLGIHMVLWYMVSGKQKEMEIGGCGREPGRHIGILALGLPWAVLQETPCSEWSCVRHSFLSSEKNPNINSLFIKQMAETL